MLDVKGIDATFIDNGYAFYYVGGCVRDLLLGDVPSDIDVTTDATPDVIKNLIGGQVDALYDVGAKYGTIGVKVGGLDIEITTYRAEEYEEGSRKPKVVFGDNLLDDLARRDFTINAIAMDVMGNTIDPFHGKVDLQVGVLDAVGNPYDRFRDDPLRLLRAIRFASKYNMMIQQGVAQAIRDEADLLQTISAERIRDEFLKMLLLPNAYTALHNLLDYGLLEQFLPEIARLYDVRQDGPHHLGKNVFMHTLDVVHNVDPTPMYRLAALFHDAGKYDTPGIQWYEDGTMKSTFYGHEDFSAKHAATCMWRLRFPNYLTRQVVKLCADHMRPYRLMKDPTKRALRRFVRAVGEGNLISVTDINERRINPLYI